jgi:hypothetical protein
VIKIVLAIILLAHAIGHTLGPLQVFRIATVNGQWNGDSWLLSGALGTTAAQAIGIMLWGAALVGFGLLAAVVLGWLPESWWAPLAIGSALASLAGLALFPTAFPLLSSVGALVVDLAVLGAAAWLRWTPAALAS